MSRKGDCWDNAVTETPFGSLKVERLAGMRFPTRRAAKDEIMSWLTFSITIGAIRRWAMSAPWNLRKSGLLNRAKPQHDPSALGGVPQGQGQCVRYEMSDYASEIPSSIRDHKPRRE